MLPIDIYKSSSELSEHSQGGGCPVHIAPAAHSSLMLLLLMLHCHLHSPSESISKLICTKSQVHMILSANHDAMQGIVLMGH